MCMICTGEIPDSFYVGKAFEFSQSGEEQSVENMKKYIGLTDEKYNELLNNEQFSNLVQILK